MVYLTAKPITTLLASSSPCLTQQVEARQSRGASYWAASPMGSSRHGMSFCTGTRSAPPAGCVP